MQVLLTFVFSGARLIKLMAWRFLMRPKGRMAYDVAIPYEAKRPNGLWCGEVKHQAARPYPANHPFHLSCPCPLPTPSCKSSHFVNTPSRSSHIIDLAQHPPLPAMSTAGMPHACHAQKASSK
eukprot:1160703-Pelagomonas_calceolata.AAC.13